ncbi:GNAT family N-acetyltransferase [Aquibacillus kalidii]|uniref:GNAT family N-acetyltransferase n=1 Tax=Aquibacillus kalidii TaxID=2762597 RepID=UPI00164698C1|nr:GNAT family N-acetyltransferase [Aquibacillus kalidii]
MQITIRQANEQDIDQLQELMIDYIVHFYKQKQPDPNELNKLIHDLQKTTDSIGTQFVASTKDGQLLGFATLYYTFSTLRVQKQIILNDLFVKQSARGQKIGEKLFQKCLTFTRENQFASMVWETDKDNHIAQALYTKMGGHLSEYLHYELS